MDLVCCHDIPLFFANIDTPGEQQKYAIALLEHLFSFLLQAATLVSLYDVGCVLDQILKMVRFQFKIINLQHLQCMLMATSGHVSLSTICTYDLDLG
jgi:hypothetical protein